MRASAHRLRTKLSPLRRSFLHPQWLVFRCEERKLDALGEVMTGTVVDIGCAEQKPRTRAPSGCRYIGLDYYLTATQWYHSKVDVFGDAQQLPFASGSVSCVLLLDVIEHLPEPERCIAEIHRILGAQGRLVVDVPFLYPIHDAPLDFHRWTRYGLVRLAERHGFRVDSVEALGSPAETAALLFNLALSRRILQWLEQKNPLVLLGALAPFLVMLANLAGAALGRRSGDGEFMSLGYRLLMSKPK